MAIAVLHGNRPWRHGQRRLLFYMGIRPWRHGQWRLPLPVSAQAKEPYISNLPLQWSDRLSVISQKLLKS
jgi:hypothetical protein